MDILLGVIIGIIVLTILVVLHELGHALVARKYGVVVEEFGVGFPPRAWAKKIKKSFLGKDVEYSINWLPLGGFVKLKGENDAANKKGDFGAVSFWQKTQILLAGVFMNFLTAAVIFTFLLLVGMPKILPNQFTLSNDTTEYKQSPQLVYVAENSPASKAGLKQGDEIVLINNQKIETSEAITKFSQANKGQTISVTYRRQNATENTAQVTLNKERNAKQGYFGVSASDRQVVRSTWSAPIAGVGVTAQLAGATLSGLGDLLYKTGNNIISQLIGSQESKQKTQDELNQVSAGVAGPVGIFGSIFPAVTKAGPVYVLMLAAVISVSLAVMNVLPIPALDGGRWFVSGIFRLIKKPLTKETEEKIHGIGFLVLMGLALLVTVLDVSKIFN